MTISNSIRPFSAMLNDSNIEVIHKKPFLAGYSFIAAVIITPIAIVETVAALTYAIFTSLIHTLSLGSSKKLQNHIVNVWAHVFHSFTMMGAVGHIFANFVSKKQYFKDLPVNCRQAALKFCEGFDKMARREMKILPFDKYQEKILEMVDRAVEKFHNSTDIKQALLSALKKDKINESKTDDEILIDFYDDLEGPIETLEYVANLTQYLEIMGTSYCPPIYISGCENRQEEILNLKNEIKKLNASEKKLLIEHLFSKDTIGKIAKIARRIKTLASSINHLNLLDKEASKGRFYLRIVNFKNKNIKKLM